MKAKDRVLKEVPLAFVEKSRYIEALWVVYEPAAWSSLPGHYHDAVLGEGCTEKLTWENAAAELEV